MSNPPNPFDRIRATLAKLPQDQCGTKQREPSLARDVAHRGPSGRLLRVSANEPLLRWLEEGKIL